MSLFLLDTNTVSLAIKGHLGVDAHLQDLAPSGWCISAVTCSQLLYGLERRPEATKLRQLPGAEGTGELSPSPPHAGRERIHA